MKIYETRKTEPKEYQQHVATKCDICGAISECGWRSSLFDAVEMTIEMKEGETYPDGGSGITTEVNLCPVCFMNKLIPWLQSQGCVPTITKWDF